MNLNQTIEAKNLPMLSFREKQILNLIFEEKSSKQIASELCISIRTVETHRANLFIKLNVKTSIGLVKVAYEIRLREKYFEESLIG